jgi:hypothetical protein
LALTPLPAFFLHFFVQVGVTHRGRWGWNYEDCLQRLTERTFYEVDTLSGLPFLKILSVLSRSSGRAF